jgi:hypothetical protein
MPVTNPHSKGASSPRAQKASAVSAFRLALLVKLDDDDAEDGDQQRRGLLGISEQKIDGPGSDQQKKHGLAQHFPGNAERAAWPGGGELVWALLAEAFCRLEFA